MIYLLKIFLSLFIFSINAEEYIINFQGKRTTIDVHQYTDKVNFRMIKLDGTFTDKLGNYGNWTAMVYIDIKKIKYIIMVLVITLFIRMSHLLLVKEVVLTMNINK